MISTGFDGFDDSYDSNTFSVGAKDLIHGGSLCLAPVGSCGLCSFSAKIIKTSASVLSHLSLHA